MTGRRGRAKIGMAVSVMAWLAVMSGCSAPDTTVSTGGTPPSVAYALGTVEVQGGVQRLGAMGAGVVARVHVQEGQRVASGDALVTLDETEAVALLAEAQGQQVQAEAQRAALAERITLSRHRAQRLRAAATAGAGEGQVAEDAEDALRQLLATQQVAQAQTTTSAQRVAAARAALARRTVRSPVAGWVTTVAVQAGVSVEAGAVLVGVLPDKPHQVRAEVAEALADRVRPGMRAVVIATADEHDVTHGATVQRISPLVGAGRLQEDASARGSLPAVECILVMDDPRALRVGARVRVRFESESAP